MARSATWKEPWSDVPGTTGRTGNGNTTTCSSAGTLRRGRLPRRAARGFHHDREDRWICPRCFHDFKEQFGWVVSKSG